MGKSREITVFYDGTHYTYRWLKALFWAKEAFKSRGISVKYADFNEALMHKFNADKLKKKLTSKKYDIVFLAYHHDTPFCSKLFSEERINILEAARMNCNQLVWLDTADSSGTCMFDVLPYVDKYLKKQLLVDVDRYKDSIWGGRIFCDYYHNKYEIQDESIENIHGIILEEKYKNKLGVSWNVALGDLFAHGGLQYLNPFGRKAPNYVSPKSEKKFDTHFRGSAWSPVAGFQRSKFKELIMNRTDLLFPDPSTKVPKKEYIQEIVCSKTVISPYGWGEICGRDFESFVYGATLLKPNMNHVITYPNWYVDNTTYVSFDWDFLNFDEVMNDIKENPQRFIQIAENSQNMIKEVYSLKGKYDFVNHITGELGL